MVSFKNHEINSSLRDLSVQFNERHTELSLVENCEERILTPRMLDGLEQLHSFSYRSAVMLILGYGNRVDVTIFNTGKDMSSIHSNSATVYTGITKDLPKHYRMIIQHCLSSLSPIWLFNFGSSVIAKNGKILRALLEQSDDFIDVYKGTLGDKTISVMKDNVTIQDKNGEIIFCSNSLDRLQKTMLKA